MVKGFLSALGVAHDEGIVGSIDDVDASEEVVRSASGAIADEYGDRAAAVYLLALLHWRAPAGKKARAWLRELCETLTETPGPEADASHAPEPETADSSEEEIEGAQDDPSRQRSFTTLDRLLILAAVDTAQGIEGSLSKDELEDAVDELVKLNGRRHQSYFHAGFRDVLLDRPVAEELPAENQSRLRWYWTGAIQGWARRKRWDCIVREYANNPVVRELGSGSNTASEAAVRHVVEALRRQGQTVEIARYVKVGALVKEPRLFAMLLDAASELLRKGDAATARPIFELLLKARSKLEERGVSPAQRLLLDAHRRAAHCLRQLQEHDRARTLLMQLLREDPDPNIHAMVYADLGLMEGGFDGLEEVALPLRRDELDGVLERLARGVGHFRKSVEVETAYSAHGHYCLGVLALGRAVCEHRFEDAEHHLQQVRVYFSEEGDSYSEDLARRADLYFGIAKAQQLLSDKLAHAADVIAKALRSGARFPVYLINPTVEAFGLAHDMTDLRRVTEAIIETGGDQALGELAGCQSALDHCPRLADELRVRAESERRPGSDRASDFRSALLGYMKTGDVENARDVLDGLERLAQDGVAVPDFLRLLQEPDRYEPAWSLDDATIARARCHEVRGEFADATRVLRDLFYRLTAQETEAGLDDAVGILDRIRGYGIEASFFSDMTDRYNALSSRFARAEETEGPVVRRRVRVLVVGGAERQAKAEDTVRILLGEHHPHIQAHLIQTGWSGNWNRTFAEIEREMERHDALVIVRFMRTNLGRQIRRQWSGVWRSCWSGGPGAIVEAVARAAAAVR